MKSYKLIWNTCIYCFVLVLVTLLTLLAACGKQEMNYHTKMFFAFPRSLISSDPMGSGLKGSFVEENVTQGVYPSGCQQQERYLLDRSNPSQRCYVIKDQIRLEEVFDEPPAVDFETQMVVITFSLVKENATYRLHDVRLENNKLILDIHWQTIKVNWDPGEHQSVRGYIMDRIEEVEEVEIVYSKTSD